MRLVRTGFWLAVGAVGGVSFLVLVRADAESVSALHLLLAAVCGLAIGYRFYSRFLALRVLGLDDGTVVITATSGDKAGAASVRVRK